MKRKRLMTGAAAVLMAVSGCSARTGTAAADLEAAAVEKADLKADEYEKWNELLEENQISEEFQTSLEEFAFSSTEAVLSGEEGNAVFSPLSLYYAMGMLSMGASGETEEELLAALGTGEKEELAEQCAKLYRTYAYTREREQVQAEEYGEGPEDSAVRLGDSLWISKEISLKPEYQETCAENFYASSYHADFTDPETGKRMGQWIADQTEGVLAPELELSPDTVLALINTLYFYGGWQDRFQESLTEKDIFTRQDGSEVEAPFMNRTDPMGGFMKGDGYTLSGLGTNNGCEMIFVLPDKGTDPDEFLGDKERLREIFSPEEEKWTSGEVVWKIPRFSFGSSFDLKTPLKSMGLGRIFDSISADFSDMSEDPLYVDRAVQEAHIGVDEEGVEGAAYTMIAMAEGAALTEEKERVEMILDRPFLFGIHDRRNDVWLFLGVCRDPSAEK